jgi:RNA polymerase sigma-70 factor (ECF subfamily)
MSSSVADLAALGKLFEEQRPRLLAMLKRRIDPALAARLDPDDILSEVFLEARRKWDRFQQQATLSPSAWLYGIARDCLIEVWRKSARDCRDHRRDLPWPEQSSAQLGMQLLHTGTGPSSAAMRAETEARIRQLLESMKDEDREILWMRHFEQFSFRELGEVLGVTENAATVRYVRALKRLRNAWLDLYGEEKKS